MRLKYRNRAIKLLSLGLVLIASLIVLLIFGTHHISDGVIALVGLMLGAGGSIFYIQGCIALAEAKGYTGASVPVMIIVSYFCLLPVLPFIPVIILFGFKDKYRDR
jgi:hypothetical protein